MAKIEKELRYISFENFELREDGDKPPRLVGYASVFDVETEIFGMWREKVAKGAYKKTIQENDIRALWNHNTDTVLGRNKAKTLTLAEDDHGLHVDIFPPDTQAGRDAVTSIKRGDVSQMSIAFQTIKQEWFYPDNRRELPLRTVKEAKLFDVSPVTFPAFETTSISARSGLLLPDGEIDPLEEARRLMRCAERGMPLTSEQRGILRAAMELYQPYLLEPEPEDTKDAKNQAAIDVEPEHHSEEPEDEPGADHWIPQPDEHYSTAEREKRISELSKSLFTRS